jgi:phytol kinase
VRKVLHISMGLVTLSFPWVFDEAWPVVLLALLSATLLLLVRWVRPLQQHVGSVLGSVDRASLGEVYFPLAVAVLFVLYQRHGGNPPERKLMLYVIPLMLLALADAAAALVGVSYGRLLYLTADGRKSAEGSAVCFTTAFLLVHVPLLVGTDVGRIECLLIALLLAWLAMTYEAIAWGGLDNLVLPLVGYLLLRIYLNLTVAELSERLLGMAVLLAIPIVYARRTTLLGSAHLAVFLMGYIYWSLGGWPWLLAPLILYLTYSLFLRRTPIRERRIHTVHPVVCVASAGLLWLFLALLLERPEFLYLHTLAFAAHLAIIAAAGLAFDHPRLGAVFVVGLSTGMSWLLLFVPYLAADGGTGPALCRAVGALPAMFAAALGFFLMQPEIRTYPNDGPRWWRQGITAGLGSASGLVPLYLLGG